MVWAIMLHIWLKYYRARRYEESRDALDALKPTIDTILVASEAASRPPHGTLSRWHYYRAHSLRGMRQFDEAVEELRLAQRSAHDRLEVRLKALADKHPKNREESEDLQRIFNYETWFATICTSRVLSAIGGVEMQRGALRRSSQFLAAAATLIEGTGQYFVKLRIRTRRATADRRLTEPDDSKPFQSLERCRDQYKDLEDISGQLGCEVEMARWRIDNLAYSDPKTPNEFQLDMLENARRNVSDVRALAKGKPAWEARALLLETRFHLVAGDLSAAERAFADLQRTNTAGDLAHRADLGIFEALLWLQRGEPERAMDLLTSVRSAFSADQLIDAECHILLAECHIAMKRDWEAAKHHLDEWERLSKTVENTYLKKEGLRVLHMFRQWKKDFSISADAENLNWEKWESALKEWLLDTACGRYPNSTLEQLRKVLGQSPSTLTRWPNAKSKTLVPRGPRRLSKTKTLPGRTESA